jgi:hypothetical protein
MRKIFAVTAIALLAFAGQAAASEGVATLAPDLGRVGFADSGDAAAGGFGMGSAFTLDALAALILIGGTVALIATGERSSNHPQSA